MLVPSRYRAAVTPRTPVEKSYSGRIVSRSGSGCWATLREFFFIATALGAAGKTGTNQPGAGTALGIGYYQEPARTRKAEDEKPLLARRMGGIGHVEGEWVTEYLGPLVEAYAMLPQVLCSLGWIPRKEVEQSVV